MTATRVCVFGDSVAKGVVFDQTRQKYAMIKDGFVNLACASLRLVPKNFSKFGCTVGKGAEMLGAHAAEIADYDLTILEFGGNDCDFDWAAIARDPAGTHLPKTPITEFIAQYGEMIRTVRAQGGKPVVLNLPPLDPQRFFDWVSRGLNADNIRQWLGGRIDYIYRWQESYSIGIAKMARALDVPLADIRSAFLLCADYAALLCADGMHPNEAGHRLISQTLQQYAEHYALGSTD